MISSQLLIVAFLLNFRTKNVRHFFLILCFYLSRNFHTHIIQARAFYRNSFTFIRNSVCFFYIKAWMIRVEEGRKKSKTSYLHTDFLKENFQDFSLFFSLFGVNFFRIYFIKKKIRKLFFVLLRGKKKLNLKKLGEKLFLGQVLQFT